MFSNEFDQPMADYAVLFVYFIQGGPISFVLSLAAFFSVYGTIYPHFYFRDRWQSDIHVCLYYSVFDELDYLIPLFGTPG